MSENNKIYEVTVANYDEVVAQSPLPVLLDIGATWCKDCVRIQPSFEAYAEKYSDKIRFAKCNFDTEEALNEKFRVRHIPTIVFIIKGEVQDILVEPKDKALFDAFVDKALAALA